MARIFVHRDKAGKVLCVASVDALAAGQTHPFRVREEDERVVELLADDPAHTENLGNVLERGMQADIPDRKASRRGSKSRRRAQNADEGSERR